MTRQDRLKEWAETLPIEKLKEIVVELTDYLIDIEEVNFYENDKIPYWDSCGDRLDGSEYPED